MPTVAGANLRHPNLNCEYFVIILSLKSEHLDPCTISFKIFQGLIYRWIQTLLIIRPNFRLFFFSEIKPDDVPKIKISLDFISVKHARYSNFLISFALFVNKVFRS